MSDGDSSPAGNDTRQAKKEDSPIGDALEAVGQGADQGGIGGVIVVGSVAAVALAGIFGYRLVKKLRSGDNTTESPPAT